jgi:carbonic anhydrase/acetyltransferase-like protein (isoleucine patch superfamily)
MRAITTLNLRIAAAAIVHGIAVGAFGFVRTGALLIALGTGVIVLARSTQVRGRRRIIESYLPLTIAGVLFALALALPKGL